MERKLATIRRIAEIKDIPGADLIQAYRVDGWWVVDSKGKYQIGTDVVYCEVDSWIPHELAPFLSKGKEPREYNGVKGERLRTVKLKGQLSQGLLLPINAIFFQPGPVYTYWKNEDVTEILNIQKWERPIPAQLRGLIKGNFPSYFRKTDQERCLSDNTIIDTDSGKYTIKHIVDNKLKVKVLSLNHDTNIIEYKDIKDWSVMTRKNNWIKITLKSGATIVCTTNHKIWCADISAYRNAEDIKIGQKFVRKTDENLIFINNIIDNSNMLKDDTVSNMPEGIFKKV